MPDRIPRTLAALSISFALGWATISMTAGPGSAALVDLSGRPKLAGLFIALLYLGSAAGAAAAGRAMDRWGRRPPLIAGCIVGAAGFAIAGAGVSSRMLVPFIVGTLLLAAAFGVMNLTRVGAADLFPSRERGRAIAWVQMSAIAGAIVGPLLLLLTEPLGRLLGRPPLEIVWFIAPPLLIVAALVLRRAAEPMEIAKHFAAEESRVAARDGVAGAVGSSQLVVAGTLALAASQAAMVAVMGVAGTAAVHAGHGANVLGTLMLMHFSGMFAFSRVAGRVSDRFGQRKTIVAGLLLLAIGGTVVATTPDIPGYAVCLLLVGIGWSFAYIGATVLLTNATDPTRRARVLGRADLTAQMSAAVVATSGGFWYAARGLSAIGFLAITVAAIPMVTFLLLANPSVAEPATSSQ